MLVQVWIAIIVHCSIMSSGNLLCLFSSMSYSCLIVANVLFDCFGLCLFFAVRPLLLLKSLADEEKDECNCIDGIWSWPSLMYDVGVSILGLPPPRDEQEMLCSLSLWS